MNTKLSTLALLAGFVASSGSSQLLELVEVETSEFLDGARSVALVPGDAVLLVAATGDNTIRSYQRGAVDGLLTFQDEETNDGIFSGLREPNGVALSPDGQFAYLSSGLVGSIAVLSVSPVGDLEMVQVVTNFAPGVDGIWLNKGVAVSADGSYVAGSGEVNIFNSAGAVALFARDATDGTISFLSNVEDGVTAGVLALGQGGVPFWSADGLLYVVSETGNSVTTFSIDNDALVFASAVVDGVGDVTGIGGASSIVFSANGEDAYVTGAGSGSVVHFTRNTTTGELSFGEAFFDGVGGIDGLGGAMHAVLNAAGDRLYVTGATDGAVAVFARSGDGNLTYLGFVQDGVAGADGLAGAAGATMSSDGAFLYVAAFDEAAVGVFARGTGGPGGADAVDFGDAPDPTFPTLLASNGASHAITDGALRLGALIDVEQDGQPDALSSLDDSTLLDDEDGVVFIEPLVPGGLADIQVSASLPGLLDAWIDWNADGDWDDAGERIANAVALAAGDNTVSVSVPVTAVGSTQVATRFRLSTAGVAGPGGAAADGEVEDHPATTGSAADLSVTPSPDAVTDWGLPFAMAILVGNGGGSDVTGAGVAITMNSAASNVIWSCVATNGLCTASGVGDIADSVDLDAGGSALYTISGTVTNGDPGPFVTASATVTAPLGVPDPNPANNSATARKKILSMFMDGFETGDTSRWSFVAP